MVDRRWLAIVMPDGVRDKKLFVSHFATCPDAKKFRKPKKVEPR
jgi:hypothetical protein